jgi:BirA family biotin operon repressor/biotin-[acetyl-CoA-carboxylase] ligase
MPSQKQDEPIWQQITQTGQLDGRPIILFDSIDSTNTRACALAKEGAKTGTVIIANTQHKGRGRLGKAWNSPKGTGLYFSIISRPHLAPADLSKITLSVGLALRNAVAEVCGIETLLKWPNDLLFEQKKMAGVLTEATLHTGGSPTVRLRSYATVIIGVGLNVNTAPSAFPTDLANRATSMFIAAGEHFDRGAVLKAILNEIEEEIERLANNDFKGILADWKNHDATYGQQLTWLTPKGDKVTGLSLGPDDDGLLHIQDATGTIHPVLSGNLEIIPRQ